MQVTPDYLQYQLWSIPTHITGALAHSLTTSSLLQAVGISAGPVGATATAAAIKWILKVPLPARHAHTHTHTCKRVKRRRGPQSMCGGMPQQGARATYAALCWQTSAHRACHASHADVGSPSDAAPHARLRMQDGIGSAGRFLVGGRLGAELDDDPRRWRMVAELLATIGMALEVATSLYPQHFLRERAAHTRLRLPACVVACWGMHARARLRAWQDVAAPFKVYWGSAKPALRA